MTAIASWVNRESFDSIWTIGDTKVTDAGSGETFSLESSKVFELTIRCKNLNKLHKRQQAYYEHSIGFSFAGSSLVGLNVYATLSTILSNLGGSKGEIPTLQSIAEVTSRVARLYFLNVASPTNSFECIVYGFCNVRGKLERYWIYPLSADEFEIQKIEDSDMLMLGQHKDEIRERINSEMQSHPDKSSLDYWRIPLKILSQIAIKGEYPTIGGGTQLNIASLAGCFPYQAVRERNDSDIKFRNIDIFEDIGNEVGECSIAIDGLDYKF